MRLAPWSRRPGRWAPALIFLLVAVMAAACEPSAERPAERPSIILIVADDLGYGELGSYGQEKIRTPVLDRLAEQGMRFTRHYSGSPVCAPSRAALLTGLHTGHAPVRDNDEMTERGDVWRDTLIEGNHPLEAGTRTIGRMLQDAGYVTGVIGKWGLGGPGDSGEPNLQGFDHWYGYLCQREAHNYYPTHLWRDGRKEALPGNPYFLAHQRLPRDSDPDDPDSFAAYRGQTYTMDVLLEDAEAFIREHADRPFFLYLPFPVPHAALQVPDVWVEGYAGAFEETPYTGDRGYLPHPTPRAAYAAMITRMDSGIGQLLSVLAELGIADHTVVMFTSDNGPTFNGGTDSDFFDSTAGLRGLKTSLYEGGIRVPLIVRWPGRVEPGSESDHVSAFWDYLPTLAEIAGADPSVAAGSDGISMVPELTGDEAAQASHDYLYWEYHGAQAILEGGWKAIRTTPDASLQLYDLDSDPAESGDVASENADRVERLAVVMDRARTPSDFFPLDPFAAARLGRVRRACGLVSAAVRSSLGVVPDTPVDPGGHGAPRPACEVRLRRESFAAPAGEEPLRAVRSAFESAGWALDTALLADGPGTSTSAWAQEDVRCQVTGGWPSSLVDGEIVRDGAFLLEARCLATDLDP